MRMQQFAYTPLSFIKAVAEVGRRQGRANTALFLDLPLPSRGEGWGEGDEVSNKGSIEWKSLPTQDGERLVSEVL